jgi:hypothetical protein
MIFLVWHTPWKKIIGTPLPRYRRRRCFFSESLLASSDIGWLCCLGCRLHRRYHLTDAAQPRADFPVLDAGPAFSASSSPNASRNWDPAFSSPNTSRNWDRTGNAVLVILSIDYGLFLFSLSSQLLYEFLNWCSTSGDWHSLLPQLLDVTELGAQLQHQDQESGSELDRYQQHFT